LKYTGQELSVFFESKHVDLRTLIVVKIGVEVVQLKH